MSEKNVKVFCRFRPLNQSEIENGSTKPIRIVNNQKVYIQTELKSDVRPDIKSEQNFEFDYIFPETAQQEDVYEIVGKPLIEEILKGYNATIFAYGQSGSGKTKSMSGYSHLVDNAELLSRDDIIMWNNANDMGVIPRLIKDIFDAIKTKKNHEFSIQLSYVEVYLEKIRDLLNPLKDNLEIRENRYKGLWIEDVKEVYVSSFGDAVVTMRKAELNRTVAATAMNAHSSRSHSVLIIGLKQLNTKTQAKTMSRVVFVDLAGSEKIEKTKADGLLLKQAQYTNKSLLNLGLVIRALIEKKPHVPYRDSKLTRLLTDSLGGNSKTHLIVTCSPASYNIEETISTLRFGSITQQIKNKPRVNLEINIDEYKRLLLQANEKIATQQLIINAQQKDLKRILRMCEKKGIDIKAFKKEYSLAVEIKQTDDSYEESLERFQELTKEVESKSNLIGELNRTILAVKDEIEKSKDLNEILRDDLDHKGQDLEAKTREAEEYRLKSEDIARLYETLQRQIEEKRDEWTYKVEEAVLTSTGAVEENIALKTKIDQLVIENQEIRENSLRTWKGGHTPKKEIDDVVQLQDQVTKLIQSEEDAKQLLEAKTRHVKVLEDSLRASNAKVQELVSDHKRKNIEYDKKIKDLESQIRILKHTSITPVSNIHAPLKY